MVDRIKSGSSVSLVLILLQIIFFLFIAFQASTQLVWIWAIVSFVPAALMCLLETKGKIIVLSLILLFVSQQAIFVFTNPSWGFSSGSDQINDFHIASVLSQSTHFTLGQLGYVTRTSYSYYPMLHLFSVLMADVSGLPLNDVALYGIPFIDAAMVTIALFYLNSELFGLEGPERNIATLLFETGFYYTAFQSQFIRETFAFPLVLLSFYLLAKTARSNNRSYFCILILLAVTITLSHQVSSFLFVGILAIMAFGFTLFRKNNRLNRFFFIAAVILSAYTAFVALNFSTEEGTMAIQGLQALLTKEGSATILTSSSKSIYYLSLAFYVIIGALILIGGLKLLREKKKNRALLFILAIFTGMFVLSMMLRFSTSANPWSWTYYMGLRGTIWAFVGVSVLAAMGLVWILGLARKARKGVFLLVIVICVLAAGKFSQYPTLVTNSADQPLNYTNYVGALWLRGVSNHGSNMLIAPYQQDINGFETARDMAPYAYLREYFLNVQNGPSFGDFYGYIAFVGSYYDQYRNSTTIQIIYSNGPTEIGYRPDPTG